MIKNLSLLVILLSVVMVSFFGCEGPEGPPGPAGADGADGALFCLTCHDPAVMDEKEAEYELAGHSEAYTRFNNGNCAACHSHEGYIDYGNGGQVLLAEAYTHGSTMTCGTCHSHSNNGAPAVFEEGVVPIRFNDPVVMRTLVDNMDFGDNNNVCIRCHQPRTAWSGYDDGTGDAVMITSTHAGPHYGAQSTTLMGLGGDHRLNSLLESMGPSPHGTDAGCVSCHMNEGNHSFKPAAAACEECHEVDADFDHGGLRAEIATKMATLAGLLTAVEGKAIKQDSTNTWVVIPDSTVHGILHEEAGEFHPVLGQFDRDVYSAFWNYMTVLEDQSGGVHNPPYIEALLNASIAAIE
jgi:hypothetical protein